MTTALQSHPFNRFFRRLHRGEEAQGMVFGAISLFMLAACIGLVHNSGVVTSRRIETQTAADAAAYAGSLVSANIISDIAWMNDGMAYVYYNMMRYAVDVTVYRTIAELRDHNRWMWKDGAIRERRDYLDPMQYSTEYQQIVRRLEGYRSGEPADWYQEAYRRAAEMIPDGEKWLQIISDMEEGLAISGKYLVREAVCRTAAEEGNNVAAVAMVQTDPTGPIFMHRSDVPDIDMILEYNPNGQPLWSITYNGTPYMEVYKHGPNHWEIVRPGVQSVDIYRHSDTEWTITTGNLTTNIKRYPDGTLEVTVSGSQSAQLLCMPLGNGRWAVVGQAAGKNISFKPFKDGGYTLTVNGSTVGMRTKDGKMQQYKGGTWQDVPGQGTVTVGGEEIPINFNDHIDLNPPSGVPSLDFPGTINLGPMSFTLPNQVNFAGTTVTLSQDSVKITARVGNVALTIDGDNNNCASLNGRSTCDPNSANKRGYWIRGVYGHDRIETVTPGRKWIYKWRKIRAIFAREDLERFGYHAVADSYRATGIDNDWTEWFDVSTGDRKNLDAYHQTIKCWNPGDLADGRLDGFIGDPARYSRCPTCNISDAEIDNDGDGISDVRKYGRPDSNDLFFQYYILNDPSLSRLVPDDPRERTLQIVVLDGNVKPLRMTESAFAHPLLVAVWIEADAPFLGRRSAPPIDVFRDSRGEIQARKTGPSRWIPFFRNPEWGYFAVACSRVGVLSSRTSAYSFTFDEEVDLNYDFDFDDIDFENRLDTRDDWLASWHNLYEPVWTARLWSTSEIVKSVDMEIASRQQELNEWSDVSRNFVWRVLQQHSPWIDPDSEEIIDPDYVRQAHDAFGRMRGPRSGRFHVGMNTPREELQEALRH